MNRYSRLIFGIFLASSVLTLAPAAMRAEVTRVEISSRQDVLNGKAFGTVGAYKKLAGKVYFTVDPNNPHNKIIADIGKAPRNSQDKVEFSADLFILRPKDPSRGNGVALFDVVNRGRKGVLTTFNRGTGSTDPPNARIFTLAGAKHGPGSWPPADSATQPLKVNPNDYRWAQRALLVALDRWTRQGVAPPLSRRPQLSDGTPVAQRDIKYPSVPAVQWPLHVPGVRAAPSPILNEMPVSAEVG